MSTNDEQRYSPVILSPNFKDFPRQAIAPFSLRNLYGTSFLSAMLILALQPLAGLARDVDWDSLNLTSSQQSQINRLENNWEKTHEEINAQIEQDMAELRRILPTGDTGRIRQLQSRIATNKMYLMNQSMDTFLKKRDMLTPTQRSQLQKILPSRD